MCQLVVYQIPEEFPKQVQFDWGDLSDGEDEKGIFMVKKTVYSGPLQPGNEGLIV